TGVMDLAPVLNEELLELGKKMADKTFSFQISCFQTMLPAVMRAKYEKYIKVLKSESTELPEIYQNRNSMIPFKEIEEGPYLSLFLNLKEKGIVDLYYAVKDQRTKKKIKYSRILLSPETAQQEMELLGKRAPKQREFLEWILKS